MLKGPDGKPIARIQEIAYNPVKNLLYVLGGDPNLDPTGFIDASTGDWLRNAPRTRPPLAFDESGDVLIGASGTINVASGEWTWFARDKQFKSNLRFVSPSGKYTAAVEPNGKLMILEATTGKHLRTYDVKLPEDMTWTIHKFVWHPDEKQAALIIKDDPGVLVVDFPDLP